jgi:diadenosine tetraphosphate (Ap4A) HIT family hydrolase
VSLYCFGNVRTEEQRAEMARLNAAGICLFCPGQLSRHPRQRILLSTAHWTVTPNEYPYPGTSAHLLVVPHQHASDLLELSDEVRSDFWVALGAAVEARGIRHYGLGVRNGDCRFTGATITHVHAHVLVGSDDPAAPPVRMRFSSRPG